MWSRLQLKENAKSVLRLNYWMAFAVCAILVVIGGIVSSAVSGKLVSNLHNGFSQMWYSGYGAYRFSWLLPVFTVVSLLAMAFSFALSVFLTNPLSAGAGRFFMESREYRSDLNSLFSAFTSGRYLNTVKALFFQKLYIYLWSLLFVIPGIVKMYQYRMVPYLMAENPQMDARRALDLSRMMTQGHKWDLFVLDLSFLGWILLGTMLCGVGVLFVSPYVQATNAEAYAFFRQKAFATGLSDERELPGFFPRPGTRA